MDWLLDINWRNTFVPDVAMLEIVMRGTIVYLALFFLLWMVLKRQSGGMGVTDLLVIVLIADASPKCNGGRVHIYPKRYSARGNHHLLELYTRLARVPVSATSASHLPAGTSACQGWSDAPA
jgi:hypothetical protein